MGRFRLPLQLLVIALFVIAQLANPAPQTAYAVSCVLTSDPATSTLKPELAEAMVNQGLPGGPMTRSKETLAKFFLTLPTTCTVTTGQSIAITGATVEVNNGSETFTGIATYQTYSATKPPKLSAAPASPNSPADPLFVVSGDKLRPAANTGQFTATFTASVTAKVKDGTTDFTRTFAFSGSKLFDQKTNALRILVVPMGDTSLRYSTQFPDSARTAVQNAVLTLSRILPAPAGIGALTSDTGGIRYTINGGMVNVADLPGWDAAVGKLCGSQLNFDTIKARLAGFLSDWNSANPSFTADRVVGAISSTISKTGADGCAEGMASVSSPESWVRAIPDTSTTPSKTGAILAMEINHNTPRTTSPGWHSSLSQADGTAVDRAYSITARKYLQYDRNVMKVDTTQPWDNTTTVLEEDDFDVARCILGGVLAFGGPCTASGTVGTATGVAAGPSLVIEGSTDGTAAGTKINTYYTTDVGRFTAAVPPSPWRVRQIVAATGAILRDDGVEVAFESSIHTTIASAGATPVGAVNAVVDSVLGGGATRIVFGKQTPGDFLALHTVDQPGAAPTATLSIPTTPIVPRGGSATFTANIQTPAGVGPTIASVPAALSFALSAADAPQGAAASARQVSGPIGVLTDRRAVHLTPPSNPQPSKLIDPPGANARSASSSVVAVTCNVIPPAGTLSPSTVTLSFSANPAVFGQPVTITAAVFSANSPLFGDRVDFDLHLPGGTTQPLGTACLSEGTGTTKSAKLTVNLPVGTHTIGAHYFGDDLCAPADATPVTLTVNNASTTTLTSSPNPSVFGQAVTFTATVTPVSPGAGTPTGTVTFKNGATTIGTGTLSSGVATFTTSALAAGNHSITAVYSGDSNFAGSTSNTVSQTVKSVVSPAASCGRQAAGVSLPTSVFASTVTAGGGPNFADTWVTPYAFSVGGTISGWKAQFLGGNLTTGPGVPTGMQLKVLRPVPGMNKVEVIAASPLFDPRPILQARLPGYPFFQTQDSAIEFPGGGLAVQAGDLAGLTTTSDPAVGGYFYPFMANPAASRIRTQNVPVGGTIDLGDPFTGTLANLAPALEVKLADSTISMDFSPAATQAVPAGTSATFTETLTASTSAAEGEANCFVSVNINGALNLVQSHARKVIVGKIPVTGTVTTAASYEKSLDIFYRSDADTPFHVMQSNLQPTQVSADGTTATFNTTVDVSLLPPSASGTGTIFGRASDDFSVSSLTAATAQKTVNVLKVQPLVAAIYNPSPGAVISRESTLAVTGSATGSSGAPLPDADHTIQVFGPGTLLASATGRQADFKAIAGGWPVGTLLVKLTATEGSASAMAEATVTVFDDDVPPSVSIAIADTPSGRKQVTVNASDNLGGSGLHAVTGRIKRTTATGTVEFDAPLPTVASGAASYSASFLLPGADVPDTDLSVYGTYDISVIATDRADNTADRSNSATASAGFNLYLTFQGFDPPLDNPPTVNVAKAGRTVPFKFRLLGFGGSIISDTAAIHSITTQLASCASFTGVENTVPEEVTLAGQTSIRFDATEQKFIANVPIEGTAGQCKLGDVTLISGQHHQVNLKLK